MIVPDAQVTLRRVDASCAQTWEETQSLVFDYPVTGVGAGPLKITAATYGPHHGLYVAGIIPQTYGDFVARFVVPQ